MTKGDFELTLLQSCVQEPGTRAGYLKKVAENNQIDPIIFLVRLKEAYQRLSEYVNYVRKITFPDGRLVPEEQELNDDGTLTPVKQSLNLLHAYPKGGLMGTLTHKNIAELLGAINEFENSISERERPTVIKKECYNSLYAAFKDPEKDQMYQGIMDNLVSQKCCEAGTLCWLWNKENLVGFLKDLHRKNYLHRKLTHKEMTIIAEKDFGVTLGEHVCSTKPDNVLLPAIPASSTTTINHIIGQPVGRNGMI